MFIVVAAHVEKASTKGATQQLRHSILLLVLQRWEGQGSAMGIGDGQTSLATSGTDHGTVKSHWYEIHKTLPPLAESLMKQDLCLAHCVAATAEAKDIARGQIATTLSHVKLDGQQERREMLKQAARGPAKPSWVDRVRIRDAKLEPGRITFHPWQRTAVGPQRIDEEARCEDDASAKGDVLLGTAGAASDAGSDGGTNLETNCGASQGPPP